MSWIIDTATRGRDGIMAGQGKDLTPPGGFTTIKGIPPACNPQSQKLVSGPGSQSVRENMMGLLEGRSTRTGIPGYGPSGSREAISQQPHLVRIAHSLAHLQMENRRTLEAGLLRLHDAMLQAISLAVRIDKLVQGGGRSGAERTGQTGDQDAGED